MNADWKKEIVYQIYPRSFCDSNGDGLGDLRGIISKLDYLSSLGVTALWLSPVFKSPMEDNGYDISDYRHVDPIFGTDEDMDVLIDEAEKRGLKIILDLVVNHTSSEHRWFQEALKSRDNPYHDYYIWREKPNSLESVFRGSAWQYVPSLRQYYLHLFAPGQPDLNWSNPNLRIEVYSLMNYWLDKGVAGFRMDVIEYIGKDPDRLIVANGPHLHDYLQEMNRLVLAPHQAMTVGECWAADNETRLLYTDPKRHELSMVFQFDQWTRFWDPKYGKWGRRDFVMKEYRDAIFAQQMSDPSRSWPALFWDNHDLPRALSYCCSHFFRDRAAKMLFGLSVFLRGTPFIYQGDELGMEDAGFISVGQLKDIESKNAYLDLQKQGMPVEEARRCVLKVGRDNARIPMQWAEGAGHGFSAAPAWIHSPKEDSGHSAEVEDRDPESVLSFYKRCLSLRRGKNRNVFLFGAFEPLFSESESLWMYRRIFAGKSFVILGNFSIKEIKNPLFVLEPILSNVPLQTQSLPPFYFGIFPSASL
ncbi:MAG: alpha-glucosidase [Bacilli bacterium]